MVLYLLLLEMGYSACVSTEDQCKWCSTTWFILLKEINDYTTNYVIYASLITQCYSEWIGNLLHSVGRWSSRITCLKLVLLCPSSSFLHLCRIPTDLFSLQWGGLTLFRSSPPPPHPPLQTSSRKPWIQATARVSVGHNYITRNQWGLLKNITGVENLSAQSL
jgi:hypothetical protein